MSGTPKRKPGRTPELALSIQYGVRSAQLPSRAKLGRWVRAALRKKASVTLRLVGAREARQQGISRDAHYAHLAVHGTLHLQGMDHARSAPAKRSLSVEDVQLGLIEVARA